VARTCRGQVGAQGGDLDRQPLDFCARRVSLLGHPVGQGHGLIPFALDFSARLLQRLPLGL
jgi:hypothetical protein